MNWSNENGVLFLLIGGKGACGNHVVPRVAGLSAPEINISPVPDSVSNSRRFVPLIRNSCRSSVNDILLKIENLPVILTGRKRILSVTHEIVPTVTDDRRLFHALKEEFLSSHMQLF